MQVRLFKPAIHEEAIAAAAAAMRSGWLGMGPKVAEFEKAFAAYLDIPAGHAVALNTGTSALHLAVKLLNLERGAEVITTPNSFAASAQILLWEGLTPIFADIDPRTGNIEPAAVQAKLSDRTSAILIVHFAGQPCDLERLRTIAARRGIPIIEDCAHACGARFAGKRVGSHGNLAAFSFGPTKNLTTGDGGMLIVRSPQETDRARSVRYLGLTQDIHRRVAVAGATGRHWEYDIPTPGLRYHMNDITAAIGLEQLKVLDPANARRARIADRYRAALANVPGLRLLATPPSAASGESSHYLFCILAENRDALAESLQSRGITVSVHYKPLTNYPIFQSADLPQAQNFYTRELSLPMYPDLTDEQIDHVITSIKKGW